MKLRIFSMMLAGVLMACAIAAPAKPPRSAPPPTPAPASRPASLEQAVRQVQHQTQGHILAADTVSRGQTNVYRIKVLTPQGKVQVMQLHSSPPKDHSSKSRSDQGGH